MKQALTAAAIVAACCFSRGAHAAIIIDDFSGGVTAVNHPEGSGAFSTWYDITSDAFGTPSAGTLDGSAALKIDDGGFTNGVYAIYESVVPADGFYSVSADMHITETVDGQAAIDAYQIGVIVNGVHRGPNPSDLATISGPGTAVGNYIGLTDNDDTALATQTVTTTIFSASAGDNLVIAFSTDLDSGDFDSNSATWGGNFVLVDNIMLNTEIPEPASVALAVIGVLGAIAVTFR